MSHFAKLGRANITSVEAFIAGCAELGLLAVERNVEIKAWDSNDKPMKVDVFCRFPGKAGADQWSAARYGIGLVKNAEGKYDMVSDWSLTGYYLADAIKSQLPPGFPGKDGAGGGAFKACEALRGRITQLTTKHAIVARYKREGYRATIVEDDDHNINVQLTKF